MYYPYLRGKQYELLALRELLEKDLISKDAVIPIVEPMKETATFIKTLDIYNENRYPFYTIINPQVGDYECYESEHPIFGKETIPKNDVLCMNDENYQKYLDYLSDSDSFITIYSNRDELQKSDSLDEKNLIPDLNFVKDSSRFKNYFKKKGQKVGLIRDAFEKKKRNVDYYEVTDEFFTDDHLYYYEDGYSAFCDYSVIGEPFIEGGFAPIAVAIHIVYFDDENILRIKHFVSDSNTDISNPAGKAQEALVKMEKWYKDITPKNQSAGLQQLINFLETKRYPGLAVIKKLSIMHHLEIMNNFLLSEGQR